MKNQNGVFLQNPLEKQSQLGIPMKSNTDWSLLDLFSDYVVHSTQKTDRRSCHWRKSCFLSTFLYQGS